MCRFGTGLAAAQTSLCAVQEPVLMCQGSEFHLGERCWMLFNEFNELCELLQGAL